MLNGHSTFPGFFYAKLVSKPADYNNDGDKVLYLSMDITISYTVEQIIDWIFG